MNRSRTISQRASSRSSTTLRQSAGSVEGADLGAMSSERQVLTVEEHLRDAIMRRRARAYGRRTTKGVPEGGAFHEPTVLTMSRTR